MKDVLKPENKHACLCMHVLENRPCMGTFAGKQDFASEPIRRSRVTSALKIYNATSSLVRFEKKILLLITL
jgi:hypothetical protein